MVQRQTVKFILFEKLVILLTNFISIYLQLNLSLPAFAESYPSMGIMTLHSYLFSR